ncbi:MAG: hypothetical protein V1672_02110 [Candidatus Diapherotrites archaeon]
MNSKAQIASLDFILSVVLVVVALGLTMQTIETNQYTMKEMEVHNELARIGETAADILVSHPDVTCDLLDNSSVKIGELQNCIVKSVFNGKTHSEIKILLGVPSDYDLRIDLDQGSNFQGNQVNVSNPSESYYSADRLIVFWSPANQPGIKKQKLYLQCMTGVGCGELQNRALTVKVWKVP